MQPIVDKPRPRDRRPGSLNPACEDAPAASHCRSRRLCSLRWEPPSPLSTPAGSSGGIRRPAGSSRSRAAGCITGEEAPRGAPRAAPSSSCTAPRRTSSNPCSVSARASRSRYRVIALDRPGHGWSERKRGLGAAEPARQAALLAGVLRQLDVRNAVIVGHSWSGADRPPSRPRSCGRDRGDPDPVRHHLALAGRHDRLVPPPDRFPGGLADVPDPRGAGICCSGPWMRERTVRRRRRPLGASSRKAFIPLAFRPKAFEANMQDFAVMYEQSWSRARATGTSDYRRS